jgi:uncharacterized membrane-anchored protein YitT (DUF2179 family)
MTKKLRSLIAVVVGIVSLAVASVASAAADTVLSGQTDGIKAYFQDNLGTVIGLFIAVACVLWMFRLAARSAGAKTPSKAG